MDKNKHTKYLHLAARLLVIGLISATSSSAQAGDLFSKRINSPAGHQAWALAAGDFNSDGKIDLAVTNNDFNLVHTQVNVLLGDGDGIFQKPTRYEVGGEPTSVAVGDFNGDGKPDLVVVNHHLQHRPGKISVLLGNGDGTFQPQVTYKGGDAPWQVAVGDFNGDGKSDLAVTREGKPGLVSILLGNGDGTFRPQLKVLAGHNPFYIAVGDFNGDGITDLLVAGEGPKIATTSLLGNGDGTFHVAWTVNNQEAASGIALGDFNGDGKLDVAETYSDVARVTIRLGNGDGTFAEGKHYTVGRTPGPIVVADFDGDGKLDIAVADFFGENVSVLLGNGDGSFTPEGSYALKPAAGAVEMIVADVNGDGQPDLVITDHFNGVVSVLLNTGKK